MARRHRLLRLLCLALPALALLLSLLGAAAPPAPPPAAWRGLAAPLQPPPPPPPSSPSTGLYACSLHAPAHAGAARPPPCAQHPPDALEAHILAHYAAFTANSTFLVGAAAELAWPSAGWTPGTVHRAPPPQPPPPSDAAGCLALGHRHTLEVRARDARGARVATAGSYLEARLEGALLRYRPRVTDQGDGRYLVQVLLPDDAALRGARVVLRLVQLYSRYGGLTLNDGWYYCRPDELVVEAEFILAGAGGCGGLAAAHARQPPLPAPAASCSSLAFTAQPFWEGHWLRLPEAPGYLHGRGPPARECPRGACTGDATGAWTRWVYRLPHCHFHLFSLGGARRCLHGSHLWGSGDSNWVDSQRNLLAHVLGLDIEGWLVPNDFVLHGKSNDMPGARWAGRSEAHPGSHAVAPAWGAAGHSWAEFVGEPRAGSGGQYGVWNVGARGAPLPLAPRDAFNLSFRLGGIYNGAPSVPDRNYGLATVYHGGWRGRHEAHWRALGGAGGGAGGAFPTALVLNSGLHDGLRFFGHPFLLKDYLQVSSDMVAFWAGLRNASRGSGSGSASAAGCTPRVFWKHTVAPGGGAREMKSNPQKMEVFNRLMVGRLLEAGGAGGAAPEAPEAPPPQRRPRQHPSCPRPFQVPVDEATGAAAFEYIDTFDMTFPFHFDNSATDGGHYGRWSCDGSPQRRCDSVDLMVLQVLLNGLCSAEESE